MVQGLGAGDFVSGLGEGVEGVEDLGLKTSEVGDVWV